jgi:hypothetical protein
LKNSVLDGAGASTRPSAEPSCDALCAMGSGETEVGPLEHAPTTLANAIAAAEAREHRSLVELRIMKKNPSHAT